MSRDTQTVGSLIVALKGLDPDLPVVQAVDPEGNGFWRTIDVQIGVADFNEGIEIHSTREDIDAMMKEDPSCGYTEEDYPPDDAVPCVVLWP